MRRIILIALTTTLGLGVGLHNAAAQQNDAQSKAEFYVGAGECGFNFTITYRNETITGSIAWTEEGLTPRLPPEAFVVANGKLAENTGDVFDAILSRKKLAVGFYDGTILPIDLIGLDPKPFVACVGQSLSQREKLHWR
jgi:hypothetical protein